MEGTGGIRTGPDGFAGFAAEGMGLLAFRPGCGGPCRTGGVSAGGGWLAGCSGALVSGCGGVAVKTGGL